MECKTSAELLEILSSPKCSASESVSFAGFRFLFSSDEALDLLGNQLAVSSSVQVLDLRDISPLPSLEALSRLVARMSHRKGFKLLLNAVKDAAGQKTLLARAAPTMWIEFEEGKALKGTKPEFGVIAALVKEGKTDQVGGIRTDIDNSPDKDVVPSKSVRERLKKPWEK
jgi:hypothetical protein